MKIFNIFKKQPKKEVNKHKGVPPINGTWQNDELTIHFGVNNYQATNKAGMAEGQYDWTDNVVVWKTCRRLAGFHHDIFDVKNVDYKIIKNRYEPEKLTLVLKFDDKNVVLWQL